MLRSLGGDGVYLQHLTPYPKTQVRKELLELDLIVNKHGYSNYTGFACNIRTKHLTHEELKRAKRRAVLSFIMDYFKPGGYLLRKRTRFYVTVGLKLFVRDMFYKIYNRLDMRQHDLA